MPASSIWSSGSAWEMVRSMESGAGPPPKLLFAAFIFQTPVKFGLAAAEAVPASRVTASSARGTVLIARLRRKAAAKVPAGADR